MSDNFIPLTQSTPVQNRWNQEKNQQQRSFFDKRRQSGQRRGGHNNSNWGNNSRSSYGSNSSNNSFGQDTRGNIDAYLHPSMLQDPWANLRKENQKNSISN